jgi:hypothetical protein
MKRKESAAKDIRHIKDFETQAKQSGYIRRTLSEPSASVMQRIKDFDAHMKQLGYTRLTLHEKKKMFKRLGIVFPKRVTGTHHAQQMYVCEVDGYRSVINSGIVAYRLLTPGLSWAMITCDDKRLFVRAFKSDLDEPTEQMLDRMEAYAFVMKNMLRLRPLDPKTNKLKSLVEREEEFINTEGHFRKRLRAYWVCPNSPSEYVFSATNLYQLLESLDPKLVKAFKKKEAQTEYYYEHRTAIRFRKDVRKKSKVTNPKNRIARV